MKGLELIKQCRMKVHPWYPICDLIYKETPQVSTRGYFNLGWNAGIIDFIPYFAKCWSYGEYTYLNVYLSYDRYGDLEVEEITSMLVLDDLFKLVKVFPKTMLNHYVDKHGNTFLNYSTCVCDMDGVYLDDLHILPYCYLNNLIKDNDLEDDPDALIK